MHFKKVLLVGERLSKRRLLRDVINIQAPLIFSIDSVAGKILILDFNNYYTDTFLDDYDIRAFTIKARLKINLSLRIKFFFKVIE